jgi:hypothetical protein
LRISSIGTCTVPIEMPSSNDRIRIHIANR